jgi:hypothetical protein
MQISKQRFPSLGVAQVFRNYFQFAHRFVIREDLPLLRESAAGPPQSSASWEAVPIGRGANRVPRPD